MARSNSSKSKTSGSKSRSGKTKTAATKSSTPAKAKTAAKKPAAATKKAATKPAAKARTAAKKPAAKAKTSRSSKTKTKAGTKLAISQQLKTVILTDVLFVPVATVPVWLFMFSGADILFLLLFLIGVLALVATPMALKLWVKNKPDGTAFSWIEAVGAAVVLVAGGIAVSFGLFYATVLIAYLVTG